MATQVIPTVAEARAAANAWFIDHLPDRFAAGVPIYDPPHEGWRIPVWLAYPGLVPLGPVGALFVDAVSGKVQAHTPLVQMKTQALHLYDQHRAAMDDCPGLTPWFPHLRPCGRLPSAAQCHP